MPKTENEKHNATPMSMEALVARYDLLIHIPSITISRLTFAINSSELTDESIRSLDKLAGAINTILMRSPNEVFLIEGHTDFPGSQEGNARLSMRRAKAVFDALVDVDNVRAHNLTYHGFGSSQLAIKTHNSEVQNR
jgi:outer membrane protein OmpA-like peptidoglycan-associated protein